MMVRPYKAPIRLGVIEMTLPDKPSSKLQQYRLTSLGFSLQKQLNSK